MLERSTYVNWLGLVGLRLVEGEGWKKVGCEGLGRLVVGYVGFQYLRLFSKPNKTERFSMSTGSVHDFLPQKYEY